MNDRLPIQPQLTLYDDTVSVVSGRHFCGERQFALPKKGNKVTLLADGKATFEAIHDALCSATSFIWIADWQMAFDVELAHRGSTDHKGRLLQVFEDIISKKPVHIRVLLWGSPHDKAVATYDGMVAARLNAINKKEHPGSIRVHGQPSTAGSIGFSHHQKFVIVDGRVAFLGGIDLTYGRHDTPEFDVIVDPARQVLNEMYSPCQTRLRSPSAREAELIAKGFAAPYGGTLIDEGCQPRMPWQDVHVRLEGPAVVDLHRNFARRWNFLPLPSSQLLQKEWLQKIGATPLLQAARSGKPGGAIVQIVRSVSAGHLASELNAPPRNGRGPGDLELEKPEVAQVWRSALPSWKDEPQNNILQAMVNCIRSATNYVYIETQFFISDFGIADQVGAGPRSSAQAGIGNPLLTELANRVAHHINAGTPFHVYLVLPVHPEGSIRDDATWKQHWMALQSISRGTDSLVNRIKRALEAKARAQSLQAGKRGADAADTKAHQAKESPADGWSRYLTVLNMRSHGVAVQYARDPKTFDEDFTKEIGRYVLTEQVYIHSKLMIVDDAVAIVGSANMNERSLSGDGDTEIAAVIVDTEDVRYEDLGSPQFKVHTRKFARELRRQLWAKHFGFAVEEKSYFASTARVPPAFNPVGIAEHPPRLKTTEQSFFKAQGAEGIPWRTVLDKPCHPDSVAAIQALAKSNRVAYEAVFTHIPRNDFTKFEEGLTSFTQPYRSSRSAQFQLANEAAANSQRHTYAKGMTSARSPQEGLEKFDKAQVKRIDDSTLGVIPAPLAAPFMTTTLMPHQAAALRHADPAARYVLYNGAVHDIKKATDHLKANVVGFLVLAPLDWGKDVTPDRFDGLYLRLIKITRNESSANSFQG